MSALLQHIRLLLERQGLAGSTVLEIERELVQRFGGQKTYVPRILPAVTQARRELREAGLPPSTARWKVPPE